jgi:hypothetical protein
VTVSASNVHISLRDDGLVVNSDFMEVVDNTAPARLRETLGPVVLSFDAGVKGSGRSVDVLRSGVVLLYDKARLVSMSVCFDGNDGNPYPKVVPEVPEFIGSLEVCGLTFVSGEVESSITEVPGVSGFAGQYSVKEGRLFAAFTFEKRRNNLGKRAGARRLVRLSAEWGGVVGFHRE